MAEVTYVSSTDREAWDAFTAWVPEPRRSTAVDTETTGLEIFADDFRCRLIQFGDRQRAFVLDLEEGGEAMAQLARWALRECPRLAMHHATFDCLVIDRVGIAPLEETLVKTTDTRLMAHLIDPRQPQDGGIGHGLKQLAEAYVDPNAPDSQAALKAAAREAGLSMGEAFARLPITPDSPLVYYAGMDVILTARLLDELGPLIKAGKRQSELLQFERRVQYVLAKMERRGMRIDVGYSEQLVWDLLAEEDACVQEAQRLGIENVNSTKQVAEALIERGVELTERTPSGAWKVDRKVLGLLKGPGEEVAEAVLGAKNSAKFRTSYVEGTLDLLDRDSRVHPRINSLQARTARMSVSHPPLQQLPSGDHRIRRMFVAEPGELIGAADYSQVELRVLGALAKEKHILQAVADEVDLHDLTAEQVGCSRKVAKAVNFLTVYGGGAKSLALVAGITMQEAKEALAGYHRAFPGVKRFGNDLMRKAEFGKKEVVTISGRRLPLDRNRLYAATNYVVQSAARDVMGEALLALEEAELDRYLLMVVHDEVIFSAPRREAEEVARAIGEAMTMEFAGVRLDAEGEVYGRSWGHGYGAED